MLHETDPEVRHAYAESIAALRERAALGGQGGRVKLVDICPLRQRFLLTDFRLSLIIRKVRPRSGVGGRPALSLGALSLQAKVVPKRPATLWTVAYRLGPSFRGLWWAKALGKTEL